jgi:hypothetical protein
MFGSVSLEVAIGLIFIFILVSIICSTIREGIEALLKTRAAYLEHGIRELLQDAEGKGIARSIYEHPLISGLYPGGYKFKTKGGKKPPVFARGGDLPSYIPAKNFAMALMDTAARGVPTNTASSAGNSTPISLASVRANIANIENPFVQRVLLTAMDGAQDNLELARKNIEDWFNSSMDRVSGWYKRATGWILLMIGLVVAVGMNINAISIADYLYKNDAARTAVVSRAQEAAKFTTQDSGRYEAAKKEIGELPLPIGWEKGWGAIRHEGEAGYDGAWNHFWAPVLGWLIIALAATMGAPFWFDLLNKIMVIRSTVKPHEKSPDEGSEDRQTNEQKPPVVVFQGLRAEAQVEPQNNGRAALMAFHDDADEADGCGIVTDVLTKDEDLPPSTGG